MKRMLLAAALAAAFTAHADEPADSTTIAVATSLGEMVKYNLDGLEARGIKVDYDEFAGVFARALKGEPTGMTAREANEYMTRLFERVRAAGEAKADTIREKAFVDEAAAAEGAIVLPSGTVMQIITEGEGEMPAPTDTVMVRYVGKLSDGKVFDDELAEAVEFEAGRLIKGFTDGLTHMRPGGTYRLVIPAAAGYGERGVPGVIPGNSALDFTVTLDAIKKGD